MDCSCQFVVCDSKHIDINPVTEHDGAVFKKGGRGVELIAERGRFFVIVARGGGAHASGAVVENSGVLVLHKRHQLVNSVSVFGHGNTVRTGPKTTLYLPCKA